MCKWKEDGDVHQITYAIIVLKKIILGVNLDENVEDGDDSFRVSVNSMEKHISPIHSYSSHTVNMISNIVDNDAILCDVRQFNQNFVTFDLHFRWWSWQNYTYELFWFINPNLDWEKFLFTVMHSTLCVHIMHTKKKSRNEMLCYDTHKNFRHCNSFRWLHFLCLNFQFKSILVILCHVSIRS